MNTICYPNKIIREDPVFSHITTGPYVEETLPADIAASGEWSLNFNFKFDRPPAVTPPFVLDDTLPVLRIEMVSAASGNTLFMQLNAVYKTDSNWVPQVVNDKESIEYDQVNLWLYERFCAASFVNSNTEGKQWFKLICSQQKGDDKDELAVNEPWVLTTQVIKMKYFAPSDTATRYFPGGVGRIDFISGFIDTSTSMTEDERLITFKLPSRTV